MIVIAVIIRQDVDGHFGTTLKFPAGMLSIIMSAITQKPVNWLTASYWLPVIGYQLTGFEFAIRFTALLLSRQIR